MRGGGVIGFLRPAGGPVVAVLLAHIWLWGSRTDDAWAFYLGLGAVGFVAGAIAGSWWSPLLVPAAVVVSLSLRPVLECPECRTYSEFTPASAAGIAFLAVSLLTFSSALPIGAAAGTLAAKAAAGRVASLAGRPMRKNRAPAERRAGPPGRSKLTLTPGLRAGVVATVIAAVIAIEAGVAVYRDATRNPPASNYGPGPAWDGKGGGRWSEHRMTQRDLERFGDYPLYWLGESFAGYNLQQVDRIAGVFFAYGECKVTPCHHPASVQVRSSCDEPRPELVMGSLTSPRTLTTARGGALVVRYGDGHVHLWTGRASISIYAHGDKEQIAEAVEQLGRTGGDARPHTAAVLVAERMAGQALHELRGVGANAAVRAGADLPPPDFSAC